MMRSKAEKTEQPHRATNTTTLYPHPKQYPITPFAQHALAHQPTRTHDFAQTPEHTPTVISIVCFSFDLDLFSKPNQSQAY